MTIANIHQNSTSLVNITAKNKVYKIGPVEIISDKANFKKAFAKKSNIGLILNDVEILEEDITIPSTVKQQATIKDNARAKLNKDIKRDDDFVINIARTIPDLAFDTTTYTIEAIAEPDIIKAIENITNIEDIKKISTPQHALFSISEEYYSGSSYLSVFIEEETNVIVLASNGSLHFSRIGQFDIIDNCIVDVSDRIKDIERTLMYVKQQFRQINIEFIVIQDSLNDNMAIVTQLSELSPIKVIPFEQINSKTDPIMVKKMTLEIGVLISKEKTNFLPSIVKKAVKLHKIALFTMLISGLFFLASILSFQNISMEYNETVAEHHKAKKDFIDHIDMISPLPEVMINGVKMNIDGALKRQGSFLKNLIIAAPITNFMRPTNIHYGQKEDISKLDIYFEKQFTTLKELSSFKESFKLKISEIKAQDGVIVKTVYRTNYGNLIFKSTVSIAEKSKKDVDKLSTVGTPPV